jgi:uncharacterized protein YqjF (DUF2071 family)
MATHELLNLRAYVRHRGEPGIFFLAEWIPNRLSAFLGPRTFGLPYRLGRLNYQHHHERGDLRGCVEIATQGRQDPLRLEYHAGLSSGDENAFEPCAAHSLAEFLLERYTAFTQYRSRARFFRVWHTPWRQTPVRVSLLDDTLLRGALPCLHAAKLVAANYSPGVQNVWMGRPHAVESCGSRNSVLGGFYEMP